MAASRYRFAPSPTGYLHLGNARTALLNAVLAIRENGTFLLRLDDTDTERSRDEFAEAIVEDLHWLGIAPNEAVRQSDRLALYDEAFERLRAEGLVYPCYETPDELQRQRKRLAARGRPPIYDRSALRLSAAEREALEQGGRSPHWRFLLPNQDGDPAGPRRTEIEWDDAVLGRQVVDLASLSDPVLRRGDGTYLYTLPSVVDDARTGVTSIVRGADHVTNTGVQIALFRALGHDVPRFGHHNLLLDPEGEGLSKRHGSLSLRGLREGGFEPEAVVAAAVLTGTSEPLRPTSAKALAEWFDPATMSHSPARTSMTELEALNRTVVHAMPYAEARPRLAALGADEGEAFWNAVHANLDRVADAARWAAIVRGEGARYPSGEDAAFLAEAATLLPETLDAGAWKAWTTALRERTGRKGRALFMPLRLALTGLDHGPELADLLPLMDRNVVLGRLEP